MNWKNLLKNPPCDNCRVVVRRIKDGEELIVLGRYIAGAHVLKVTKAFKDYVSYHLDKTPQGIEIFYINLDEIVG